MEGLRERLQKMNKCQHTSSPAKVGRLCACRSMEALICLDFSIFGDIAEGPYLHFSMNLCYVLNTEEITQVRMKGCLMTYASRLTKSNQFLKKKKVLKNIRCVEAYIKTQVCIAFSPFLKL
jgi:hypothetical protein